MKSLDRLAATISASFSANSSVGTSSLPSRCPHRFGNTWSSTWRAAAPARSYSTTVRTAHSTSPYPVSASAITGSPEPSAISRMVRQTSVIVRSPTSGYPATFAVAPPET